MTSQNKNKGILLRHTRVRVNLLHRGDNQVLEP